MLAFAERDRHRGERMFKVFTCLSLVAIVPFAPLYAQAPIVVGAEETPMLHVGQQVVLRTLVELTTMNKMLRVGQRVPLEVAEGVTLNGQTIIPVGTPGIGEITTVRNKGAWGKSGKFEGRVISIRVGNREIRMSGSFDDKGSAGGGVAAATSAIVFLPAGFFMTGTSAKLPIGAPVSGFLAEDVPVVLAASGVPEPVRAISTAPLMGATPAPSTIVKADLIKR